MFWVNTAMAGKVTEHAISIESTEVGQTSTGRYRGIDAAVSTNL